MTHEEGEDVQHAIWSHPWCFDDHATATRALERLKELEAENRRLRESQAGSGERVCVHGHKTRQVGCAACVAVFDFKAAGSGEGWRPIATAPRDRRILVGLIVDGVLQRVSDARFQHVGFYTWNGGVACHWATHWTDAPPVDPPAAAPQLGQEWVTKVTSSDGPDVSVIGVPPAAAPEPERTGLHSNTCDLVGFRQGYNAPGVCSCGADAPAAVPEPEKEK